MFFLVSLVEKDYHKLGFSSTAVSNILTNSVTTSTLEMMEGVGYLEAFRLSINIRVPSFRLSKTLKLLLCI